MGGMKDLFTFGEAYSRPSDLSTSHAASDKIRGSKARHLEGIVTKAVWDAGESGLTWNEAAIVTGLDKGSISPRWKPLRKQKLIMAKRDSDGNEIKRNHQMVWVKYENS